jgi:hypothetical protein
MEQEYTMACHLLGALGAGALIGFERSFHGRPAGFRRSRSRPRCSRIEQTRSWTRSAPGSIVDPLVPLHPNIV